MKEDAISVSVIVSVYNAAPFLWQCLSSITGQTLRNIEIICVNDGSTDDSLTILEQFAAKDSRIAVYTKLNEGMGAAPARNYGLERARGEYVSILDSDDFFEPEMLEKAFIRAKSTDAEIVVFGGAEYDDQDGGTRRVASILNDAVIPALDVFSCRDCPDSIYQLTQGMAWNKLFRRTFLEKHGLRFQKIKYTDDAYFTFAHLALAERIAVVPDTLCYYRVNSGRNQTSGIANYPDSAYLPYIKLKDSLIQWGLYDMLRRSFLNCVSVFIRYCYDMIDRYDALEYLHEKLRREVFQALDISTAAREDFYDPYIPPWVRQVKEYSAPELLFQAARAHGSASGTTAILRFRFPYERIPAKSRVAILGARIIGQHYYSQAILSGWCDVVAWVDWENPLDYESIQSVNILNSIVFDYVLVAYSEMDKVVNALSWLRGTGVPDRKIVIKDNAIK